MFHLDVLVLGSNQFINLNSKFHHSVMVSSLARSSEEQYTLLRPVIAINMRVEDRRD